MFIVNLWNPENIFLFMVTSSGTIILLLLIYFVYPRLDKIYKVIRYGNENSLDTFIKKTLLNAKQGGQTNNLTINTIQGIEANLAEGKDLLLETVAFLWFHDPKDKNQLLLLAKIIKGMDFDIYIDPLTKRIYARSTEKSLPLLPRLIENMDYDKKVIFKKRILEENKRRRKKEKRLQRSIKIKRGRR